MKMRRNPSDKGLTINHPTYGDQQRLLIKATKCHVWRDGTFITYIPEQLFESEWVYRLGFTGYR
eukprot:COSAG01_NODE_52060_length_349_cov_1.240000_1_plen_63_part_01